MMKDNIIKKGFRYLAARGYFNFLPDEIYLRAKYWACTGRKMNLKNPTRFNEKLQWLKIYERKNIYSKMVDKYSAKEYVSNLIGSEYIIPTLGVWDSFDDIDFSELPNQFVLKCTHDSGGLVICRDKKALDLSKTRAKIEKSLKKNYYFSGREWPYKNVKPRIIAEKYMEDNDSQELRDYKFYCFDGIPKFLYLSQGMEKHETARIDFLNLKWEKEPFYREDYKRFDRIPPQPEKLDEMIELCKKLAGDIPFLRVDFYQINHKVFFGELTFSPGSGFSEFVPDEWNEIIGSWITLPSKKSEEHDR
jgi:hypothetical protein